MGSYAGQRRQMSFVSGWIKFALLGVIISVFFQGALGDIEPTESQCRSYIEKALKEQHLEVDEKNAEGEIVEVLVNEQEELPPTDELTDSIEDLVSKENEGNDTDDDNDDEKAEVNEYEDDAKEDVKTDEDNNKEDEAKNKEQNDDFEREEGNVETDGLEVESTEDEAKGEDVDTTEEEHVDSDDKIDTDDKNKNEKSEEEEKEIKLSPSNDDDSNLDIPIAIDVQEVEIDDDVDIDNNDNDNDKETNDADDAGIQDEQDDRPPENEDDKQASEDSADDDENEAKEEEKEELEGDDKDTEEEKEEVEGDDRDSEEEKEEVEGDDKDTEEEKEEVEGDDRDSEEEKEEVEGDDKDSEEEKEEVEGDDKDTEEEKEKVELDDKDTEEDDRKESNLETEYDEKEKEKKKNEIEVKEVENEASDKKDDDGDDDEGDEVEEKMEKKDTEKKIKVEGAAEIQAEVEADQEAPEEEELIKEMVIPENLRSRDHIDKILKLEDSGLETILEKTIDTTLKALKGLYDNAIKPLEMLYKYRDLSNRHFGDPEIFSKPLILFMGPWSGGKSSTINYLLDNEFSHTSLRTGAEPSPAYFNILMHGEEEEILDGTQLAADWTFSGLQKFGQSLLDRLKGIKLRNKLLEKVNIVEIPGILEIRKQVQRLFPFNDACQWFIDRADIIFLVYDPSKLDVGPETEAILDQLKGREYQTRIILNKADQVKPEELMRVQGTLIWNISPLMSSSEPPIMYSTSLWSLPYEVGAPTRLLQAQERAFLRDLREAIDKRVENKIASARRFAVRVRNHAKMVDCYLTTYYNHKTIFGNRKKISDDIIEYPQKYHIYEGLSTLTNISRYDLPDPDVYKDFFKINPLYEFKKLSETCTYFRGCPINKLDVAIAYDLPELVGKYRKAVETAKEQLQKENS